MSSYLLRAKQIIEDWYVLWYVCDIYADQQTAEQAAYWLNHNEGGPECEYEVQVLTVR